MRYVKQILFPEETVLYDGRVAPVQLFPGLLILAASALIGHIGAGTGDKRSIVLSLFKSISESSPSLDWMYQFLLGWQQASPDVGMDIKFIALAVGLWGAKRLFSALILMRTTELVITDQRIIAKMGWFNIVTLEMDRRRVAEVMIDQSMWGRMLNYGYIYIRGFTGVIGGMPEMVNPHMVERFLNIRY